MLRHFNCFKGVGTRSRKNSTNPPKAGKNDSDLITQSEVPRGAIEKGPVVIKTAKHGASLIRRQPLQTKSAREAIRQLSDYGGVDFGTAKLLRSSFDNGIPDGSRAAKHGFVNAAIEAYGTHHHLIIRPDDIWLAIMTQFSFYVNANAETLRRHFVAHQGQKELRVFNPRDTETFISMIVNLIEENVTDPDLRTWILPNFTTTTTDDTLVASVVMMGTLQAYFKYFDCVTCGIPSVTLLGEVKDYEQILHRLDKLEKFGEQATEFKTLLVPILKGFISCFHDPDGEETRTFWNNVAKVDGGSGPDSLSGWITAFCYWNSQGVVLPRTQAELSSVATTWHPMCQLSGVYYDAIEMDDVPSGFSRVPITRVLDDVEYSAELLAGSVGINCTSSGEKIKCRDGKEVAGLDTLQPQVGWFYYIKEGLSVVKD